MKIIKKLGIAIAILGMAFTSCKKDDNNEVYSGENKAYLKASTQEIVMGGDKEGVEVKLTLTKGVEQNTEVEVVVVDEGMKGKIELVPSKVVFKAGDKIASFRVKIKEGADIKSQERVKINIIESAGIVKGEDLVITIKPEVKAVKLTDKQKELLEEYKKKGIDLLPFLGKIKVTGKLYSSKDGYLKEFAKSFEKDINGETLIELSQKSNKDEAVLKMSENPFGITDFLYYVFRKETIENDEFWLQELSGEDIKKSMKMLNWNKDSKEVFKMSLDGIKFGEVKNGVAEVKFLEKKDIEGDIKMVVPFDFEYTAWDRLQEMAKTNREAENLLHVDGTSNPYHYINNGNLEKDEYDGGVFVPSKGEIDFNNGVMKFTFLVGHTTGSDYLKFVVEYKVK